MSRFTILVLCFCALTFSGVVGRTDQVCFHLPPCSNSKPDCNCNLGDVAKLKKQVSVLRGYSCRGGLIYNNQCIRFPYARNPGCSFAKAEKICSDLNATLIEITSDEMYDQVYRYLQKYMIQYTKSSGSSWTSVKFWLGSKLETTRSNKYVITLRNGRKVRLTKWSSSPASISSWTRMYVSVEASGRVKGGIRNFTPSFSIPVALCATQLPN